MKLITAKDYQDMSKKAADIMIKKVTNSENPVLGLATGGTPLGTYQQLCEDHRRNGTSYQHVTTFNLDEYIGVKKEDPNSYYSYMKRHLFQHLDIFPSNTHIPDGTAANLAEECERYEEEIARHGGIDLQLLGIGRNGHIGFNEPHTSFQSTTHIVTLEEATIAANARYFTRVEDVPREAITMGIQSILKAKEILLLVSGESKKEALHQLLHHEVVSESFPASVLRRHPHVTIIADEQALSLVHERAALSSFSIN